jgi:hypothetical protein
MFQADNAVNDIVLHNNKILAGTDSGSLLEFDINSSKKKVIIKLDKIKDFMGDMIDSKIFSIDYLNGKYLIVGDSGKGGFSNLIVFKDGKKRLLIDSENRIAIIKAKFIDDKRVFFVDLGSFAYLLDMDSGKILYSTQISGSKFSDFALNKDKTMAVVAGESGVLKIVDVNSGRILKKVERLHLDNVFSVSFGKNLIASGSQDRKGGYYNINTEEKGFFKGNFLVYSTAISPNEKMIAYAMDADNTIKIYRLSTKSVDFKLKGQKSILTVMKFLNNKTLISASHDDTIMLWKLKK